MQFIEKDRRHYVEIQIPLEGAYLSVIPCGRDPVEIKTVQELQACQVALISTVSKYRFLEANFVTWRVAKFLISEDWGPSDVGREMRMFEMLRRAG